MTKERFTDYQLSTTNIIAAVERGEDTFDNAARWIHASIAPFFGSDVAPDIPVPGENSGVWKNPAKAIFLRVREVFVDGTRNPAPSANKPIDPWLQDFCPASKPGACIPASGGADISHISSLWEPSDGKSGR
jgi:hypothetical protein